MAAARLALGTAAALSTALLARRLLGGVRLVAPIPGAVVTSGWMDARPHRDGRHAGIDLRAAVGTPVRAVAAGRVTRVRQRPDGLTGRFVAVEHEIRGLGRAISRYLHLDSTRVRQGDRVAAGEVIGLSGRSGIQSSAPHLHFDLRLCGEAALGRYQRLFGAPGSGFVSDGRGCALVPAEPLVPVGSYADRVRRRARERGVRLLG